MSLLTRNCIVETSLKDGKIKKSGVFEICSTDENIFNIFIILKRFKVRTK